MILKLFKDFSFRFFFKSRLITQLSTVHSGLHSFGVRTYLQCNLHALLRVTKGKPVVPLSPVVFYLNKENTISCSLKIRPVWEYRIVLEKYISSTFKFTTLE